MIRPAFCLAFALSVLAVPTAGHAQNFSESYKFLKAVRDADGNEVLEFLNRPGTTIVNTRDRVSGDAALHIVVKRNDSTYLRFLLQKNANPNVQDSRGNTPMMLAIENGFAEAIDILAAYKANVNLANSSGETPLIRAVQRRDLDLVRRLLDAGADPDQGDVIAGMSARDYAARDTRTPAIAKLLADAPKQSNRPARAVSGPVL